LLGQGDLGVARRLEVFELVFLCPLIEGKYSEVLWAGMPTGGVGSLLAVTPL
jgi:hypothetical protein